MPPFNPEFSQERRNLLVSGSAFAAAVIVPITLLGHDAIDAIGQDLESVREDGIAHYFAGMPDCVT